MDRACNLNYKPVKPGVQWAGIILNQLDILERPAGEARREERRAAMLDAAESLFLEQGYDQTTLAAVVGRSGGSLATLYDHFGNKEGLLRAMIVRIASSNRPPVPDGSSAQTHRADQLRGFAHALYTHLTTPRNIALTRMVMIEVLRDPDFAQRVYAEIHCSIVAELAGLFAVWTEQGHARIANPEAAANLFMATIVSDTKLRVLCGNTVERLSTQELDWRLDGLITHLQIA